ncbi:hypothetical protein ACIP5Y_21510 [Nocardia sp. NPDC088792]|uniref:hypothetical protein n=1 Tax=Nocardia sp. NPDC088792 TaxID=3364332 RepID=UPI00382C2B4E
MDPTTLSVIDADGALCAQIPTTPGVSMPPRKKDAQPEEAVESGRFYELRDQAAGARRGPYKLTQDIVFPEMTRRLLKDYAAAPTEEEKAKILFGGYVDAVEALYDDRPIEEWRAFLSDVRAHYFGQGAAELPGGSQGS